MPRFPLQPEGSVGVAGPLGPHDGAHRASPAGRLVSIEPRKRLRWKWHVWTRVTWWSAGQEPTPPNGCGQRRADLRRPGRFVIPRANGAGAGGSAPTYTDSAEEVVLVLARTVEARVDDEQRRLEAGELVLIPAMRPHDIRTVGDQPVRMLGFFPGPMW